MFKIFRDIFNPWIFTWVVVIAPGVLWAGFGGAGFMPDPCLTGSAEIGTVCSGGAIFAGTFLQSPLHPLKLMVTPGNCDGDTPANPVCDNSAVDAGNLQKSWGPQTASVTDTVGGAATPSNVQGKDNTANLIADGGNTYPAAQYCEDMIFGGYSDWHLPSKSEMAYIYCRAISGGHVGTNPQENGNCANYSIAGGTGELTPFQFSTATPYWTSTEVGTSNAWTQYFGSGTQGQNDKTAATRLVRCVRSF